MKQNYDVVLIRHAQSTFNHATQVAAEELQLDLDWWDLVEHKEFNKRVTFNKKYMNAQLSEKGLAQCHEMKKNVKGINVNAIIVSPYTRAMQTCSILFEDAKVPVIVEPLLAEIFRYSCDVVEPLIDYKQRFPRFDFSRVEPYGHQWYLSYLSEKAKQTIEAAWASGKVERTEDRLAIILELMRKGELREEYGDFKNRIDRAKQLIKGYKQKYGPIAVVAHYHTIEWLRSKKFTEDGNVVEYKGVLNCHPYYEQIDKLMILQ